jgi:hypothetical protein
MMLTVVCWKWEQRGGRAKFDHTHVNTLYNMVARFYTEPFELVCFTDNPRGIREPIRCVPLPNFHTNIQNPLGREYPSCYRRLALFGPDLQRYVSDRFVSVDLDCVIVGDLTPIWSREEDIVFWESPLRAPDYNGSMWMAKKGAHPELYDEFHPFETPKKTLLAKKLGSDQGWFSYRLPAKPVWTSSCDGVYAWNPQIKHRGYRLPPNARIVFFPGNCQPWDRAAQERAGWVREYYR